ncbi:MAG: tRNA (adenosine(37)-N6)-threonylcarbamoyltransferase complex transferase subunit TsaD [Candidatus Omnitrophica bacterium]|nr:tRNA (adenosine(37)-N6)-threonylcarbamoyltransferase complex transferase subunit TsaD [Candidatus Omnitrophota bacterium]
MLVLGIETSCDETALALVAEGRKVLGTQIASSLASHQRYGGVVPEIASRAHVELLTLLLERVLFDCGLKPQAVERIAVTRGPGLSGSLLAGVCAARALGLAWGKPAVGVNHLQAHLYAALMERADWPLSAPMIGLVISGGHTALVRMEGIRRFSLIAQTRDDAVGEAFDKVAKLLGLGFPGGPEIERISPSGNPKAYRFSVPRMKSGSSLDFSLSGMKTAVLTQLRGLEKGPSPVSDQVKADLAASFQRSIVEEVVMKSVEAARSHRIGRLAVGGGVVANRLLRDRLSEVCGDLKIDLAVPSIGLCTDNGAMVGGLGYHLNPDAPSSLTAVPDLRVEMN